MLPQRTRFDRQFDRQFDRHRPSPREEPRMTESTSARASRLLQLHQGPELLTVVNVWDVVSAKVVADIAGPASPATASHSIAASHGYEDGENIPVEEMIDAVGRIAAA